LDALKFIFFCAKYTGNPFYLQFDTLANRCVWSPVFSQQAAKVENYFRVYC